MTQVQGGAEQGSRVFRIRGTGDAAGQPVPWSLIVKSISAGKGNSGDPQAAHFWQREPNYYRSGLLEDLPGGLRAPRCYAVVDRPGGCDLLLEEIQDCFGRPEPGRGWTMDFYSRAARILGRANSEYLLGRTIPEAEWIPLAWLRAYVEESAPNLERLFQSADRPVVKTIFAPHLDLIRRAWEERAGVLSALERLPQVFCHQDAFYRNLFAEKRGEEVGLVAVDWSYAGRAPLGAELAALVCGGLALGSIGLDDAGRLEQTCLEGYLAGLADQGWRGDPERVRLGFCATSFWRYVIGAAIGETLPLFADPQYYPLVEAQAGLSMQVIAGAVAAQMDWMAHFYAETHRLL